MNKLFNSIFLILNIIIQINHVKCISNNNNVTKPIKLPPCRVCKIFVESFKKGLERTKKGNYEGGDTAWEEEKLGSYATSEIRLVEILEMLCSDIKEGKDQCYSLIEKYDSEIEDWWFKKQHEETDLYQYFCIKLFQNCCPNQHFGPNCKPCKGYPDNICNNNGKCKGDGTRMGNGECNCNKGYTGEICEKCAKNFYQSYKDDKKLLCSKCHVSCKDSCTDAGPKGCSLCNDGWIMNEERGCVDVNECTAPKSPCTPLQFCINTEGSYHCIDCHISCAGCTGEGPDMCKTCANGFVLIDNICIDKEQESRKQHYFLTKYLTYFGLCVITFIVFNKNSILAALFGMAVATYITVSEYYLRTPFLPNLSDY